MTKTKAAVAVTASIIVAAALSAIVIPLMTATSEAPDSPSWLGDALWKGRGLDQIAQALILVVGSLAVVFLLRQEDGGVRGG